MQKVSQVRRWDQDDSNDYPYRSHMQPALAYMALAGCIFILVVSNSALLWNGFHATPFLSTFLLVRQPFSQSSPPPMSPKCFRCL